MDDPFLCGPPPGVGQRAAGAIYGRSTNSVACNGAAREPAFTRPADVLGNAEFIQVHPDGHPGGRVAFSDQRKTAR